MEQVKGVSDSIRVTSQGYSYVPLQFGGLKGQREAVIADVVVDVMDFQSKGSAD
ncbi:MAG TPA: hypothetical protein VFM18_02745 [Methanosarcina sp.]|nr:hypothetical protein [Methanosarcina sp.]